MSRRRRLPIVTGLDLLGRIAPPLAGAVAEQLWFTPPRPQGARRPLPEFLQPVELTWRDRTLTGFAGGDGPRVLLVHGWGGHAGQMVPLARSFVEAGASVVAVTHPAHGGDRRARRTDIFEMADAIAATVAAHGQPAALVAHSLGAMASVAAFTGVRPPAVFLAPVLSIEDAITGFAGQLQLRPSTTERLTVRLRRYVGDAWETLSVGPGLDWGNRLLILHDPGDPQAPVSTSRALAESAHTELVEVEGPGHHRILGHGPAVARAQGVVAAELTGRSLPSPVDAAR